MSKCERPALKCFLGLLLLPWFAQTAWAISYVNDDPVCEITTEQTAASRGFDDEKAAQWWFTGQGSQIMPYDWFLSLDTVDSGMLFRHPDNMKRYGYFYAEMASEHIEDLNPHGLPIGFAASVDPKDGKVWFGPTCAACHSNRITYKGSVRIIDGGPSQADFWQFNLDVTEALRATLQDEQKFDDFAGRLFAPAPDALRVEMQEVLARRDGYNNRNTPEHLAGHGRIDAFGVIFNEVTSAALGVPANRREPDAPVSYPFLWGTAQADVVQWNGVGDNTLPFVGPIARNIGEVMGVYGRLDIDPDTKKVSTSALYNETRHLERLLEMLPPPRWPEEFPAIDKDLCDRGAEIFAENCHRCHGFLKKENEFAHYRSTMVPLWEVGTDHKTAVNALGLVETAFYQGDPWLGNGPPLRARENAFAVVGQVVVASLETYLADIVANLMMPSNALGLLEHVRERGLLFKLPELHYKARPLNGVWATAPYLHNGSVPNLRQLIWSDEREDEFEVGCTEYDPEVVGYVQDCDGSSVLDTSIPGNTNVGHLKTQFLSERDRQAILEFLKSL